MFIEGCWNNREIKIDGKVLRPARSQRVWNHSPDGFNWGYGGSGPAQLALALLMLATDEKTAVSLHQAFKWEQVATWDQANIELNLDVDQWIKNQMQFEIERYSSIQDQDQED